MVFGTDFPHLDHDRGIFDDVVALRSTLGEDALRTILWDSPCHLMGIAGHA